MNRKRKSEQLRQRLIDAQDGLLNDEEQDRLKQDVLAHDPDLWEDHEWMMSQQRQGGLLTELAVTHSRQPDSEAIRRFHRRRELEYRDEAELEQLVWSWFRRYVLSVGILLIVLLVGLEMGFSDLNGIDGREQVEAFLGWETDEFSELDHWLYEDL